MTYSISNIGIVDSPFREKFGIPRQPGLCPHVPGSILMLPPYDIIDAFRGLEDSTHIWVLFIFHHQIAEQWQPLVRPPKLGGNSRRGVFATRSPFRPNRIGQSVVKLEGISKNNKEILINISGHDFLNGTPVIDIKPYLPYSDLKINADSTYNKLSSRRLNVSFSKNARQQCHQWEQQNPGDLALMLSEILAQDPRPGYHRDTKPDRNYGFRLFNLNIRFSSNNGDIIVNNITESDT